MLVKYLIEDIIKKNGKIKIIFQDDIFDISQDNYLRFGYLYPGKELSLEEINDLKKYEDDEKYYQYVKYLNKNYCLSKVELENKLCEKKRILFSKAKYILDNLENQGVINDKNTIIFRIDDLKMKHFSPQKIKELLVNKYNYSNSLVESIEIELDENEYETSYFLSLLNGNSQYPLKKRKENFQKKLLQKGYTKDQIEEIFQDFNEEFLSSDFSEAVFEKEFQKLNKKYGDMNKAMKQKNIKRELLNIGYPISYINEALNNLEEEEEDSKIFELAERFYLQAMNRNVSEEKRRNFFIGKLYKLGYTLNEIQDVIREKEYEF